MAKKKDPTITPKTQVVHYETASPVVLAQQPANPKSKKQRPDLKWEQERGLSEARINQLRAWRYSWWMENWADLAEFILPRRSIWLTQSSGGLPTPNSMTRGREINKSIVDPTATYAARICSGGLVSGLVSPSRPWFKMMALSGRRELDTDARKWMDDTEDRVYTILASTNFYESEAQEKEDIVVFGTAPTIVYEDERDIFRCYNPCIGEYYLANDGSNRVNAFAREFLQTIQQTVDFFGAEVAPADIQAMWAQKGSGLDQERIISHLIEPNFALGDDNLGVVEGNFAWRETYWVRGTSGFEPLSKRGFHEQPFTVARWSTQSNDAYGRSPGMDILPDVMQLQVMTRRLAEAIEKQARPPLVADMSMKNQPSSSIPGAITYVPKLGPDSGMRPMYQVNPDIRAMAENIAQIEQRIKIGLFNDLFLMLEQAPNDRKTAYEVAQKIQEKLQVLGPVIEGMIGVLRVKLKRIFGILRRKGLIDPPPKSLRGIPVSVDFISTLALAQKATATGGLERLIALVGNLAPVFPQVKDLVDADSYVRIMSDLLGNPQRVLFSPEHVQQIREAAEKKAQAMQAMAAMQHSAQTANTAAQAGQVLSQTQIGGGQSALSALMGGGSQ